MRRLLITYDLNKQGQNYKALYEAIKALGAWWHYLDSTWMVQTYDTVQSASDKLLKHIDKNDFLLVVDVTGDTMQGWLPKEAWDWIQGRAA